MFACANERVSNPPPVPMFKLLTSLKVQIQSINLTTGEHFKKKKVGLKLRNL